MYICPICNAEFEKEDIMAKHLLACWREKNPHHKSTPAPRSEDVETRQVDAGVMDFFNKFKE